MQKEAKVRQKDLKPYMLRIVLPILILVLAGVALFMHKANINSEIPVDYTEDPYPLSACKDK